MNISRIRAIHKRADRLVETRYTRLQENEIYNLLSKDVPYLCDELERLNKIVGNPKNVPGYDALEYKRFRNTIYWLRYYREVLKPRAEKAKKFVK